MVRKNGVYVMEVDFLVDGKRVPGEVIIDSRAAECVMPKHLLPELKTLEKKAGVRFAAANGGEMGNYGRKIVCGKRRAFHVAWLSTNFWSGSSKVLQVATRS